MDFWVFESPRGDAPDAKQRNGLPGTWWMSSTVEVSTTYNSTWSRHQSEWVRESQEGKELFLIQVYLEKMFGANIFGEPWNFSTLADSVVFGREWKALAVSRQFDLRWHHYMRCMPSQPTHAGVWQIWSRLALEITPRAKAKMEVFCFSPV